MTFIRLVNDLRDNKKQARFVLKSGHTITGVVVKPADGIAYIEMSGKPIAHVDISEIAAIEYQ